MADFVQYSRQVKYSKKTVNQLKEKLTKKGQTFPVKKNKEYYIQLLLDLSSSEDEIEQDENQQVIKPKKETKIKEPKEEKIIDFEKFNNELESIYENFKETKEDKNKKNLFKKEIMTSLKQNDIFKDTEINECGSSISGFGTIYSNADFLLKTSQQENVSDIFKLKEIENQLKQNVIGTDYKLQNSIFPKLLLKDKFNTDYSISLNQEGLKTSNLLALYNRLDERSNEMIVLIKIWARENKIDAALNSLSLTLMGIFYLQNTQPSVLPVIDTSRKESFKDMKWSSSNHSTLSKLFFGFIEYYSKFPFAEKKISVRTGELLKITNNAKIYIQEPYNHTNTSINISPEKLRLISGSFKLSLKVMKKEDSVLSLFPQKKQPFFFAFQESKRKTSNQTNDSDEIERPTKRHKVLSSIENSIKH